MAARKTVSIASLQKQIAKLQAELNRLSAKKPKRAKRKRVKKKPVRKRAPKKRVRKTKKKRKKVSLVKKVKKKATKKNLKQGEKIREEFRSYAVKLCETVSIAVPDLSCHWRSFQNADSTVDLEIRIGNEGLGSEELSEAILEIETIMDFMWPKEFWYIVGIQVEDDNATGSPTIDKRPHRAWLYPTHDLSRAIFRTRVGLIPKLAEYLTRNGRVTDLIIRVHWNPWDMQPKRPRR